MSKFYQKFSKKQGTVNIIFIMVLIAAIVSLNSRVISTTLTTNVNDALSLENQLNTWLPIVVIIGVSVLAILMMPLFIKVIAISAIILSVAWLINRVFLVKKSNNNHLK